jgi:hypothetical protein
MNNKRKMKKRKNTKKGWQTPEPQNKTKDFKNKKKNFKFESIMPI